jgi:hypothetical protein
MDEDAAILMLCAMLGGEPEVTHTYVTQNDKSHVRVDCETSDAVYELGLDEKRTAFDSLHQVLFAAILTGKTPRIILIDRDGIEGKQEYQVRMTAGRAGVEYSVYRAADLIQWQLTSRGPSDPAPAEGPPPS